jgi:two-component system, chemotaxis family, chemotaxis protein CheY
MVTCLLIDENQAERARIAGLLDQLAIGTTELSDVDAGVHFCNANRPDVVLLEATALPRAEAFLRLTRSQSRQTGRPVVILYASKTNMANMGQSILAGASEFLMVPFDLELLRFKLTQSGVLVARAA